MKFRRADPFVPIWLRLRDGGSIRVLSPSQFFVTRERVVVGLAPFKDGMAERSEYLSPDMIERVEPLSDLAHP